MKFTKTILLILSWAMIGSASNGKHSQEKKQDWDLPTHAKLEIHVTDADVHVIQGDMAAKVTVNVKSHSDLAGFADQVKTTFEVHDATGVLTIKQPRGGNLTVEVRVPSGTDVLLRANDGDIDIDTPFGSKDIETSAGDVRVTVGSSKQYAAIDVTTNAGDVSGNVCGKAKGWTGSSLHCTGEGKDRVRVHTSAGDVQLRESSGETAMTRE